MHGPASIITDRIEAYRRLTAATEAATERPVRLVGRLAGIDATTRSVRAIAYPAWDPPIAGTGTVTREEFDRYIDTWGTFMRASTVQALAEQFMQAGLRMDTDHTQVPDAIHVRQSWFVREGDPEFGDWPGSWAVEAKVYNDATWARIEAGELNGYSIMVYASFRTVELDVVGVGRVKVGEFVNPYPKFLSIVDAPAIREGFRSTVPEVAPADAPVEHVVRCAPQRRAAMSDAAAPTNLPPEATQATAPPEATRTDAPAEAIAARSEAEELGLFRRMAAWLSGKGAAELKRDQLVARAHAMVADEFTKIESLWLASAAMEALNWSLWTIMWDDELDNDGKRAAIVDAFAQAAALMDDRLTPAMVEENVRAMKDGDVSVAAVEHAVEACRKGAKIAKARLDKLVTARDTLTDIIDESSAAEEGRSDIPAEVGGVTPPVAVPPTGADTASREGGAGVQTQDGETPMTEAERTMLQELKDANTAMRAEIDELKQRDEAEPPAVEEPANDEPSELEQLRAEQAEMKAEIAALKRGRPAPQGTVAEREGGQPAKPGVVTVNGRSVDWSGTF